MCIRLVPVSFFAETFSSFFSLGQICSEFMMTFRIDGTLDVTVQVVRFFSRLYTGLISIIAMRANIL